MHNVNRQRAPTDIRAFNKLGYQETNIHDSKIKGIQDLFKKGAKNRSQ